MAKLCPNECGTELVQDSKGNLYCQKCDLTYAISKGKVIVTNQKGEIEILKERQDNLERVHNNLVASLKGEEALDEFGI